MRRRFDRQMRQRERQRRRREARRRRKQEGVQLRFLFFDTGHAQ